MPELHVAATVGSYIDALAACSQFFALCRQKCREGVIEDEASLVTALNQILTAHSALPSWILPNDAKPPEKLDVEMFLVTLRKECESRHNTVRKLYRECLDRAHRHVSGVVETLRFNAAQRWSAAIEAMIVAFQAYAAGHPGLAGGISTDEPHILAAARTAYLGGNGADTNVEAVVQAASTLIDDGVIGNAWAISRLCMDLQGSSPLASLRDRIAQVERAASLLASHLCNLVLAAR